MTKITKEEAGKRAVTACYKVVDLAASTIRSGCAANAALIEILKMASEGVGHNDTAAREIMTGKSDDDQLESLKTALENLIKYVEQNECQHEETHRGGFIWTICDGCGKEWADDRGGFQPYKEPKEITAAYAILSNKKR